MRRTRIARLRRTAAATLAFCALSASLCTAALWWRSYGRGEGVTWQGRDGYWNAESRHGELSFSVGRHPGAARRFHVEINEGVFYGRYQPGDPGRKDRVYATYPNVRLHWHGYGFRAFHTLQEDDGYDETWELAAPHWLPLLLSLGVAGLWARRVYRRRTAETRGRLGFCPACGYDLRATPERCPECGAAVAAR